MRKQLLLFFMFLLIYSMAWAQTKPISGKVVDNTGELVGVSVTVKGTTNGVATDVNGNFKLNVAPNAILVFRFIGYKTKEVAVGTQTQLKVTLESESSSLNEIVVVGYGTQKRGDLSVAISSVSGKDIEINPITSVAEALEGRVPGLQVTTSDGSPNGNPIIRLRGGGSVTQDNSPLYIVDGFPVADLSNIAPNDIESVDVLKDAAATAIYGSQGANGIIIVTTKKPKAGRTIISYNGYGQLRTFPRELQVLSPYEYVLAQYEFARITSQTAVDNFSKYFGAYGDLELYKNQKGTNWQKVLFGNTTASQQHSLSITGGTEKTKMSLSASDNKNQGLQVGSNFERIYMDFKLNHTISDKLTLDLTTRFSNTISNGGGTSGSATAKVGTGITTKPVNGLADFIDLSGANAVSGNDQDYEDFISSTVNPATLAAQDYRNVVTKVFTLQTALAWKVTNGLSYRTEGGVDLGFGNSKRYYGPLTLLASNNGGLPLGEITIAQAQTYRWANTLTYKFKLGPKNVFNVLGGQEIKSALASANYNRAKGFDITLPPAKLFANFAAGTPDQILSTEVQPANMMSFFGRVEYIYKNKYILSALARADGSSVFAEGHQWGFFPAAAIAWKIMDEPFMKNATFVSQLKARLSYGAVGNNRIPPYLTGPTFSIAVNRPIGFGDTNQPYYTYSSSLLPNPNLKWETTITQNAGLDFGFFHDRLTGSLDLYSNYTKDLLVTSNIPTSTGFVAQQQNIGQTSNRGIELGLTGAIVDKKGFRLNGIFNIAMNRARVDKLDGSATEIISNSGWASTDLKAIDDYRARVGGTIGLIYGYVSDGFYSVDDFSSYNASTGRYVLKPGVADNTNITGGISVRPGVAKLKDISGPNGVPDGVIDATYDRQVIGSALPKATGGFGFNASYKGFDLYTFFTWSYGNQVYNTGKQSFNMYYRTTWGNMLNTSNYASRFHYIDAAGNQVTDLEALRALNPNPTIASPYSYGNASPVAQSLEIEDGSFLRLSNVTLGYTVPLSLTKRVGISKLRVYGTVYNALLFTKYTGYDPEVSTAPSGSTDGYNVLTPGVDYSGYPKSRTFTFGLNLTF
ncbi:MAG: TonB-dependent receptor [Mucilaginibacter sp.]|uniref:SusC/RagA family TonB-linked outer membrane protein n=1 Tax=Mucilaginibacter sp. TaxID=1882438 RepID=UPI0032678D1E